ncbi:Dsl1p KNAG_0F00570 [Huiozyma naganishii CBS 8797]|uniref:Retrograde transport protein Dsl1 C-terminal domain-containing protein n=1 Tax=Huiozyma naganishii (strain ATCC MYA-139 / BCRC 22969 / CBS 8797 / KCTC 17520 / NBRC 10181 / NCYC 3082 / Yp74L-3) TaxID=1071383 RepID=J7S867_HUIN7|nr:hypothetical protein KNAG_0F00570 [Kazachstania naganishii CBS 8797]CCK70726.1 hypothetical protein KNAG_0F00570 [Kazachstania naganishii CBS 8797]
MIAHVAPEREEVLLSVERDPIFQGENGADVAASNYTQLTERIREVVAQEAQLGSMLHDLSVLKTFGDLLNEFNTNLAKSLFQDCYRALQTLRQKLNTSRDCFVKQPLHFQRSLMNYIDELHLTLIERIYEIISTDFWSVTHDSITFHNKIVCSEGSGGQFEYRQFMELVKKLFFWDDGEISTEDTWFLKDMDLNNPSSNIVRNKLSEISKNYLELNEIVVNLKRGIFDNSIKFEFQAESCTLSFTKVKNAIPNSSGSYNKAALASVVESINALADFLMQCIDGNDLVIILSKLGPLLSNELLNFLRKNATVILRDSDPSIREGIVLINNRFGVLASKSNGFWNHNRNDIEHLLNDKQLYINLLVDDAFAKTFKEIRNIFATDSWKQTSVINITNAAISQEGNQAHSDELREPAQSDTMKDDNCDWGTGDTPSRRNEETSSVTADDNDAWGEEIDIDLDDLEPETPKRDAEQTEDSAVADENDDGGWDDEWALDEEVETQGNTPRKQVSTETSIPDSVDITNLPELLLKCIHSFPDRCATIDQSQIDQQYFDYKLNLLQTSSFSLSSSRYGKEWWQLFIDMREVVKRDEKLRMIQELNTRFLERCTSLKEKYIYKTVQRQLREFITKEKSPSWSSIQEDMLPFVAQEILLPLRMIKGVEGARLSLALLNFIYNKCITEVILRWEIISEHNAENLSQLIAMVYSNTELEELNSLPAYRELRERFSLVGKFLPLHLKEIMEMFYNGDFYLFSTQEIVQWITLLFADTPLRRDAIADIHEIRETTLEDE